MKANYLRPEAELLECFPDSAILGLSNGNEIIAPSWADRWEEEDY